jgi:DNA-directed RNA polymerase subunit E'/Rpb7
VQTEGKVDYQTGLTLAVTAITDLGKGRIREGVGNAVFTVKFTCLVMKPIKGEVVDAVVTHCNPVGSAAGYNETVSSCSLCVAAADQSDRLVELTGRPLDQQ